MKGWGIVAGAGLPVSGDLVSMMALNDFSGPADQDASLQKLSSAPASWYYAGRLEDFADGPVRFGLPGGNSYVIFCPADGQPAVLDARCAHMGADLAEGCVANGRLVCPLHGWEYSGDGKCAHIPASAEIPKFARQPSFPVEVRSGHVFFFNRLKARFPLPFFEGVKDSDLLAPRCFEFTVDAPWYLVSANGFDVQHFRCAHDRTLLGEPVVDSPHEYSWRMRAAFTVTGDSFRDRLTRWISGLKVEMTIENWGGNLVLVTAKFQRTVTYGLVSFVPLDESRTLLRDIVWIPRRQSWIGRKLIDPVDARMRRSFIREFVRSDVHRSSGIQFRRSRMIAADKVLVDYMDWLQGING
jgi:phenylpropionate dioxygenase-like ring-hydroxylating dioxygenase large terminal subunit